MTDLSGINVHGFNGCDFTVVKGGRLDTLLMELKIEFPEIRFEEKSSKFFWKFLHYAILIVTIGFNRKFLKGFTTSLKNLVAFNGKSWIKIKTRPANWEYDIWKLLEHEREHLRQFKKYGLVLMLISYLFVFFPLGFAYGRAMIEKAGYLKTLECWYLTDPKKPYREEYREWWVKQFTGPNYGWAWPFRKTVEAWYDQGLSRLAKAA